MNGMLTLPVFLLLCTSGVLCETCLVYNYGSYTHRECDSCCDSGILRRCCSDTPVGNNSSLSKVGVVLGCLLGLALLVSLCGAVAKCWHRIRFWSSSRASSESIDRPSPNLACLDSTAQHVACPKPPPYSVWIAPPPYIVHDGLQHQLPAKFSHLHYNDCSSESQIESGKRCDDENVSPPPYTPRIEPDNDTPTSCHGFENNHNDE